MGFFLLTVSNTRSSSIPNDLYLTHRTERIKTVYSTCTAIQSLENKYSQKNIKNDGITKV
jgi:hypothetical protein